ncbi:MAG: hypothetical protein RMI79_07185 [Nitrososphaerota archaeon]|nr:hypothetical protein [Nitrososphaerota archaeon]
MQIMTKLIECDKDFHLARSIRLRVNNKEVVAPKRALSASQNRMFNEVVLTNDLIRGIIEVYRHIDRGKIHAMLTNNDEAARFSNEISLSLKEAKNNEIIMGVLECDIEGVLPTLEQTNMLLHILNNPYFDVVTPPLLSKVTCEAYMNFLDMFIEVYKSSSFRPALVPFIPHYSISSLPDLVRYYTEKDVFENNLICVDFNGSSPISQYMFVSAIVKEAVTLEREIKQPVFLHADNLKYGKATKKLAVAPAKDLVIFTMGFNSFGSSHKRIAISSGIGNYELKTKLLNRDDYGYYSLEKVRNVIKESQNYYVCVEDVLTNQKMARVFNAERQGLEAYELYEKIRAHELKRYVFSKSQIAKEPLILKKVNKVQETALQKTLEL